jgi:hypothetical protein
MVEIYGPTMAQQKKPGKKKKNEKRLLSLLLVHACQMSLPYQ